MEFGLIPLRCPARELDSIIEFGLNRANDTDTDTDIYWHSCGLKPNNLIHQAKKFFLFF